MKFSTFMQFFTVAFVLVVSSSMVTAQQVFYSNDFSNGMTGMTIVDVDGLTPHANIAAAVPEGKWTTYGTTNPIAISTSWYNPAGQADDWMMTPAITIPANLTNVKLSWTARSFSANYPDGYTVYVSTTGGTQTSDFTTELFSTAGENNSWTERTVDISSYAGQTIYLAYRNNSNDKYILGIDNISVFVPADMDLALESARFNNTLAGDQTVNIIVKNKGITNITSYDLTIVEDSTNQVLTHTVSGLDIPYGGVDTFTTSGITLTTDPTKIKYFTSTISNINGGNNDADASNNTFTDAFVVRNLVPQFVATDAQGNQKDLHATLASGKAVVLDFMASWCTPCQNSTPDLNNFYVNNSDKVDVWAVTVEKNDSTSVMNGLTWGGTYPKIPYSINNDIQYFHYGSPRGRGFNPGGSIPFFVMICPNTEDPANSTILINETGYDASVQNNITDRYTTALASCSAVGNNNISSLSEFNMYPNPATDVINLEFALDTKTPLTIEIRNLMGQLVKTTSTVEYSAGYHSKSIDVSELANGSYTAIIRSGDATTVTQFNVVK